jgi:ribosomal protein S18 acetylase RimI-like enzyme
VRDLTIRIAGPDDVGAIARFQTECWREAYVDLVPQDYLDSVGAAERQARWAERIIARKRNVVLAESRGEVVGVGSSGVDDGVLELKSLYVAASHQGTGLADELLTEVLGPSPAVLWVFRDNSRAIAFYARHGFTPDGATAIDPDTGLAELRLAR